MVTFNKLTAGALIYSGKVGGTSATIGNNRFVMVAATDGTADGLVLQATAGAQVLGVAVVPQATNFPELQTGFTPPVEGAVLASSGDAIDVIMDKAPAVEVAATVNAGDVLISDANGHAVPATGTPGSQVNVAGIALGSATTGGTVPILLSQGQITV